jgi:hypothetical protein
LAAGDLLEISIFDFQRDGAPAGPGALAVTPDLVDEWQQRIARGLECDKIDRKGVLGTD